MVVGLLGKSMTIVFRVDASLKIGIGHVMRCLALAQVLKKNSINVEFICRLHEGNLVDRIRLSGFHVHELVVYHEVVEDHKLVHSHWLGSAQRQDAEDCINIIEKKNINWLIVDHYAIDEEWQNTLKPHCQKIMVIDDLSDRKHHCDILLDQTFGRLKKDYLGLVPKNCQLLLGSKYALLRPEFAKWRKFSLDRRRKLEFKNLIISMGGVDADNFTGQVLKSLKTCFLPKSLNVSVIMGKNAPHTESIIAMLNSIPCLTKIEIDVHNMAEIMSNADLAIGAAGTSSWERCCLGLPTIQLVIAGNQKTIAKILEKKYAVKLLRNKEDLPSLIESFLDWGKDMSNNSRQITDGFGAKRVLSYIIATK